MAPLQPAHLELSPGDSPCPAGCDHPPRSLLGDPAQARQLFISGNQLPQRWQGRERFVILETGFGTGLNFLATWQAWRDDPERCRRLHFVCFEQHPFELDDLARIHQSWHEFADLAAALRKRWPMRVPGTHRLYLDDHQVSLTLIFGDPAQQIRAVDASVDAFFLDGSSPDNKPDAWSGAFCKGLSRLAAPGATIASRYSTDDVRQALSDAEFDISGQNTLTGQLRSRRPDRYPTPSERRAIVIGAGIAGSTTAHRLASAGWQVTVLESRANPGDGASGNIAGMLRPLPSADDNRLSRLTRAGYLATRALLAQLPDARWSPCGVLHLGRESEHEAVQRRTVEALGFPAELIQFIERDAASEKLGWPVDTGGWWFPGGGWVQPPSLCRAALAAFPERITLRCNAAVDRLNRTESTWQALAKDGEILAEAPVLVMASGIDAPRFSQFSWLPQVSARGQVSHLPSGATPGLNVVLTKLGYAMPEVDGIQLAGATLSYDDEFNDERPSDHQENLARLNLMLPGFAAGIDPATLHGRVGFRPMSPDRMPIVGPVPMPVAAGSNTRLHNLPRHPGLWCVQGFGARGIVWSALMADLLVSQLEGAPLPLENDLVNAVDPGRFLIRPARRNSAE